MVSNNNRHTSSPSRRTVVKALGAGATATALAGCGGLLGDDDDEVELEDTLRVGVLAPDAETNPVGASIRGGAQVAVNELDEEGVLDADNVEMFVGNTEGRSGPAGDVYNELILEDNVHFTIGTFATEAFMGIMDDIAAEQTLHLTTGASAMEMNRRLLDDYETNKYMFRVGPFNGELLGQALVDFAEEFYQDELGWESTYLLYEDAAWTGDTAPVVEDQLDDHGFDVVGSESYAMGTEDFSPIYDDIPADVDGVTTLMAHTGVDAAIAWKTQQRPWGFGGIHVPAQNAALPDEAVQVHEGIWTLNTATPGANITDVTASFTQAFLEQVEGFAPVYTAYLAYDAVMLYAQYAEDIGHIGADDMVEAMASNQITPATTTTQEFTFYEADHPEYPHDIEYNKDEWMAGEAAPIFNQWQGGDLVTFLPEAHRDEGVSYQQPDQA